MGRKKLVAVAPQALGGVHGLVSGLEQVGRVLRVLRKQRDANAGRHKVGLTLQLVMLGHGVDQRLRHTRRPLAVLHVLQDDRELVAPQPRHRIGTAGAGLQPLGHLLQQLVAPVVAQGVVDVFEMVQVNEQQRKLRAGLLRVLHALLQPVLEQGAVGQRGQRIEIGQRVVVPLRLAHQPHARHGHPCQRRQQQADDQAGQGHQVFGGVFDGSGFVMGQLKLHQPHAAMQVEQGGVVLAGGRRGGGIGCRVRAEHQAVGRCRGAVVYVQAQVFGVAAHGAFEQIVHAERAVHKPLELVAPVFYRAGLRGVLVHRDVQQKAKTGRLRRLRRQFQFGGDGGLARVARGLHGRSAVGLGQHVKAVGFQVAVRAGLQVGHGRVLGALTGWANVVSRQTLAALALNERVFVGRAHVLGIPNALKTGVVFADLQVGHVVVPLVARQAAQRGNQAHATAQNLLVGGHAVLNGHRELLHPRTGFGVGQFFGFVRFNAPHGHGGRHADQKHNHRGPQPAHALRNAGVTVLKQTQQAHDGRS